MWAYSKSESYFDILASPNEESSIRIRNVGKYPPTYKALYPLELKSSTLPQLPFATVTGSVQLHARHYACRCGCCSHNLTAGRRYLHTLYQLSSYWSCQLPLWYILSISIHCTNSPTTGVASCLYDVSCVSPYTAKIVQLLESPVPTVIYPVYLHAQ